MSEAQSLKIATELQLLLQGDQLTVINEDRDRAMVTLAILRSRVLKHVGW